MRNKSVSIKRPSWDEYFMMLADVTKKRADCIRGSRAAILVKKNRIIATGYNGTPHGIKNCSEGGCIRCQKREKGEIERYQFEESCVCIHAEQNAIIQAAYHGSSTKGGTLYATLSPCSTCSKMIINAGIQRVICKDLHHDQIAIQLLKQADIVVEFK
ncbi:dCMP deaminase family protein [Candidatus Roizmanbacteria bacterium]|nr:dCMP deaminase family protein [Candidatus Roizmanbacteria bacterium]